MSIFQAFILGIVQGITEFIPISSSAHLALVPYWLNWQLPEEAAFVFDVLVQMGTLVAVIIYFYKDIALIIRSFFKGIWQKKPFSTSESKIGWYIIIATLLSGVIGVLLKDRVEYAFSNPFLIAVFLLVTAVIMALAEWWQRKPREDQKVNALDAVIIGLFQTLAIFPGISRSGATISGGLFRGINRESSARFSFILSIPIMLAAGLLSLMDLFKLPDLSQFLPVMAIGFVVSAIVGYFAIAWLMKFISRKPLYYFSIYCVLISSVTLIIYHVR